MSRHQCFIKSVHYKKVFCFSLLISCFSWSFLAILDFLLVNLWCFSWILFSFRVMNMPTNCQNADVLWNVFFFINSCMFSLLGIISWSLIANTMLYCGRIMKANRKCSSSIFSLLHPSILQTAHPLNLESVPASQAPGQGHCGRMASPSQGTQTHTHSYIETISCLHSTKLSNTWEGLAGSTRNLNSGLSCCEVTVLATKPTCHLLNCC